MKRLLAILACGLSLLAGHAEATLVSSSPILLELKAVPHLGGAVVEAPANVFTVGTGLATDGKATWDIYWNLDLRALPTSPLRTLSDVLVEFFFFDPLANALETSVLPTGTTGWAASGVFSPSDIGVFDPYTTDTLFLAAEVFDANARSLASIGIAVQPEQKVPEPGTLWLAGAGLIGAMIRKYRKPDRKVWS